MFYRKFSEISSVIQDLNHYLDDDITKLKLTHFDSIIGISTKKIDDKIVSKFENLFEDLGTNIIKDKFNIMFGEYSMNFDNVCYQDLLGINNSTCSVLHQYGGLIDHCCDDSINRTAIRSYPNLKKFVTNVKNLIDDISADENRINEMILRTRENMTSSFIFINKTLELLSIYYDIKKINLKISKSFLGAYDFKRNRFSIFKDDFYKRYLVDMRYSVECGLKKELFENFLNYIESSIKISLQNYYDLIWEDYYKTVNSYGRLLDAYNISTRSSDIEKSNFTKAMRNFPMKIFTIDLKQIIRSIKRNCENIINNSVIQNLDEIAEQLSEIETAQYTIKDNIIREIENYDDMTIEDKFKLFRNRFGSSALLCKKFLFKNTKSKKINYFSKIKIN